MNKKQSKRRKYPPFWEKFIPFFLVFIGLGILFLLIVAISVAFGIWPFV